jgi:Immunity protein 21
MNWVESGGGPLIVVPVAALADWGTGGEGSTMDDYDRARAVDGLAGLIAVGESGAQALVLGDEPATTCYLPEHRVFLRWIAADSEADLVAGAEVVLADSAAPWVDCGTWRTDGPAVLLDSAETGAELDVRYPGGGAPEQAPVPVAAGRWRVRAVHANPDERTWVSLVQLVP